MNPNLHILIIGYTWPEPTTTAAGVRMMQLIELFLKQQWQVTFATTAEKTTHSEDLKLLGVSEVDIRLNDSGFDSFVKKLNPSIVVFDRFFTEEQFGWRVREQCPETLCVLDTEDLHFLRNYRDQHGLNLHDDIFEADITQREIASIYRCDVSLIISTVEKELLENKFGVPSFLLHYLPLFTEVEQSQKTPGFDKRAHIAFVGNFQHKPNIDAVEYLYNELWPIIHKELLDAELHIYGAYHPKRIAQLHAPKKGFVIKGWTPNLKEMLWQYKLLLSPLRFGAGLKGKLLQAMAHGLPFVTTPIGAEGILAKPYIKNIVGSDSETLARLTISVYRNPVLWQLLQEQGFQILHKDFDPYFYKKEFLEKLTEVQNDLRQHRLRNFTGKLLNHHQHLSVKYLSKWIETKNKL